MMQERRILKGALFSSCRRWRYLLWRVWDTSRVYCNFIMLNPSTADEEHDDPTITRCVDYARKWDYGGLVVSNIFAYRSSDPYDIMLQDNPVGNGNDGVIVEAASSAGLVVCAWGNSGAMRKRSVEIVELMKAAGIRLYCLSRNKSGEPSHPLYQKTQTTPIPLEPIVPFPVSRRRALPRIHHIRYI